jgi:large subunit ribosomal protein L10
MTREEKTKAIGELVEVISASSSFYLTDTSGLSAEATSTLRRECFKNGIKLTVVKNSLLQKALERIEGKNYEPLIGTLVGNTSVMISEASNAPAKLIKEFRKKHKKPLVKSAFIEEECYIGDDQLEALVGIKSKDELLGELIGLLQSPMMNVISSLQSGQNTLGGLMKTLEERAQ